jgi:hypothetical protein
MNPLGGKRFILEDGLISCYPNSPTNELWSLPPKTCKNEFFVEAVRISLLPMNEHIIPIGRRMKMISKRGNHKVPNL